jgi:hypothetical protein
VLWPIFWKSESGLVMFSVFGVIEGSMAGGLVRYHTVQVGRT